jgi:ABC-type glycerol-3-phosphate transport system substrate-binding protein
MTGLHHIAYNPAVITGTLPTTWNGLIQLEESGFIFPANGAEGAELVLHLYLAAGGSLTNEAGQPDLQVAPLTIALAQIGRGRSSGLISLQSGSVSNNSEAWQLLQNGAANLIQTRSAIFLGQGGLEGNWGYGPLPGIEQTAAPLLKSWVWAVSASDPARQARAVELIAWLTSPENLGPWSASSNILPARRSALENWAAPTSYLTFAQTELERALPYPPTATTAIISALNEAVFDVVTLTASPQAAAEEAAEAVRQ